MKKLIEENVMKEKDIEISRTIRVARKKMEMTRKELAKIINVHPMQIYSWEKRGASPSAKKFLLLMKTLNLSADDFLAKKAQ